MIIPASISSFSLHSSCVVTRGPDRPLLPVLPRPKHGCFPDPLPVGPGLFADGSLTFRLPPTLSSKVTSSRPACLPDAHTSPTCPAVQYPPTGLNEAFAQSSARRRPSGSSKVLPLPSYTYELGWHVASLRDVIWSRIFLHATNRPSSSARFFGVSPPRRLRAEQLRPNPPIT